jgi:hypothetical protein
VAHAGPILALAAAVLCAGALGCNLVLGAGDYGVGGSWACVGSVAQPEATDGGEVTLTLHAAPFTMGGALPAITIAACDKNDLTCATPIGLPAGTDAKGDAVLSVPSGFDGYLDATAPDMQIMESLVYLSWPVVADGGSYTLLVGSYAEYRSLVTSVQGTVPDSTGAIWVNTEDCQGRAAAGVELSLDPTWSQGTDPFYFLDGAPEPAATQDQTTTDAVGGFADVTPGRGTLTATLASNAERVASFTTAQVRRQSLTVVWLRPTPLD